MPVIHIRISDEQKEQLEQLAQARHMSISQVIRCLVDQQLENQAAETPFPDLTLAQTKALFETRILTRFLLAKINADRNETNHILQQAKATAEELARKKLGVFD